MRTPASLSELFTRYINNECAAEEITILLEHFDAGKDESLLKDLIRSCLESEKATANREDTMPDPVLQDTFTAIKQQILLHKPNRALVKRFQGSRWSKYAAAATIILVLGAATWFLHIETPDKNITANQSAGIDDNKIVPGGNRAILTLADGSTILLDSAVKGPLGSQGSTRIVKLSDGQLAYQGATATPEHSQAILLYNTISTPKGGQYQIILPDGSKVWLNAASSLRFPTTFIRDRTVELTGEAYFEIAQDPALPFTVQHNGTTVQVLGTSFNINAYTDEDDIKTTLLQGSIKVISTQSAVLLKPGQQAIVPQYADNAQSGKVRVVETDTEDAVAWKNGMFVFNDVDIKTIMRQVARWYDVDIRFEGKLPVDKFIGEVPRSSKVSEVLKIMELNNVHFKIEGKTITLLP